MGKLSQAKINVLNQFETRIDDWNFGDFEKALEQSMGERYGNYQNAKLTISEADKIGNWPKTVKRYVLTNYSSFGNSPSELVNICSRLVLDMGDEEKETWGILKK